MSRAFTNGLEDHGSIPGRIIPKTQKMVLDAALLNTHYWKDQGQSGAIQGMEKHPSQHFSVVAIEKGAFESVSTKGR